jgi:hypothetical protein
MLVCRCAAIDAPFVRNGKRFIPWNCFKRRRCRSSGACLDYAISFYEDSTPDGAGTTFRLPLIEIRARAFVMTCQGAQNQACTAWLDNNTRPYYEEGKFGIPSRGCAFDRCGVSIARRRRLRRRRFISSGSLAVWFRSNRGVIRRVIGSRIDCSLPRFFAGFPILCRLARTFLDHVDYFDSFAISNPMGLERYCWTVCGVLSLVSCSA